jgi:phosphatidylinositol alpha-1,6-mannosyltransferase
VKKTVLFVARRFPPSVGGMQTFAADIDRILRGVVNVELVALGRDSTVHLAWFLPLAAVRTLIATARGRVDRVICSDAIAWAVLAPVVSLSRVKATVMVLGLDLEFPNPIYQRWLRWALPRADRIVAISEATAAVAVKHGATPSQVVVVNPGVRSEEVSDADRAAARAELRRRLELGGDAFVAVTVGRLVRRKGVAWFVEKVVPQLPGALTYVVAGEGPTRTEIEQAAAAVRAGRRVRLLGTIDDDFRETLLRGADVFVMPNVRVPGDMEGFGLVAVEAASRGTLVIASGVEGITDAVVEGATGILVEPEVPERFVEAIRGLVEEPDRLAALASEYRREACRRFSIERLAQELPAALGV